MHLIMQILTHRVCRVTEACSHDVLLFSVSAPGAWLWPPAPGDLTWGWLALVTTLSEDQTKHTDTRIILSDLRASLTRGAFLWSVNNSNSFEAKIREHFSYYSRAHKNYLLSQALLGLAEGWNCQILFIHATEAWATECPIHILSKISVLRI